MFAISGGESRIFDPAEGARQDAVTYVKDTLPGVVKTRGEGAAVGTVTAFDSLDDTLTDAWLVVEAVPEKLDLKKSIFGDLDAKAGPDTILTSTPHPMPQDFSSTTPPTRGGC